MTAALRGVPARTLQISGPAIPQFLGQPALEPVRLSGHEGVNGLFAYELLLKTPDSLNIASSDAADFDLNAFLGSEVCCSIQLDGMGEFIPGVVGASGDRIGAGVREINAIVSPAQRQLNFDPDATEVDIYKYSEDAGRFDPEGTLTKTSDAQHRNVPDSLRPIPPLLTNGVKPPPEADVWEKQRMVESAAQKARWRGWSEILFAGPYGEILQRIERQLNNMFVDGRLAPNWTVQPPSPSGPHAPPHEPPDPMRILGKNPKAFGAIFQGDALTEDDLRKIAACWYPVHAMGYNWLQSNGESAKKIAERITGLINGYKARGFECEKVMVVTHSMGGLVARALVHPQYGIRRG